MMLIDVHAHMSYKGIIEKIDQVIRECEDNNVKIIVNQGTEPKSNRASIELSKKYKIIKPALGFYPTHILEYTDEEIEKELEFIKQSNPIAIGEIGLDYYKENFPNGITEEQKNKMKKYLKKLILIAKQKKIPIIIHSRKAELDTIELIEELNYNNVIMHCFSGKKSLVKRIIDNKWYLSIPANVNRAQHFQYIIRVTPIQQLFTETDSPFLAPTRGEINTPKNIIFGLRKIAEIKELDIEETSKLLYLNYQRLFL